MSKSGSRNTRAEGRRPRIALTPGEPAGIGPDLAIRLAQADLECDLVLVADPDLLAGRARTLGLSLDVTHRVCDPEAHEADPSTVAVEPVALAAPARPGRLDPANAGYVLNTLERGVDLCRSGACDALVTGPLNKAVINRAGIDFSGHTGFLAERTGAGQAVMMLASGTFRVALATVHIPLAEVPAAIDTGGLQTTLAVLEHDLRTRFGIDRPRILVAGVNPHAGEDGYLGREEIDVIAPAIAAMQARGLDLEGPLPADTLFTPERLQNADAVLAMYHDQGLPVIKHTGFGRTVNVTLGLPIIRTSVDHGTALELAGTGRASEASLRAALALAGELAAAAHRDTA